MAFVNNFSTSFRWCDRLFGTDAKFREYRQRVRAMRKLNLSPEEYAAKIGRASCRERVCPYV